MVEDDGRLGADRLETGRGFRLLDGAFPHTHGTHALKKRIQTRLPLSLVRALDGHPLAAAVLLERARSLSREPSRELVALVGHGPVSDEDNAKWLKTMEGLGQTVWKQGGVAAFWTATFRDDAAPEVREKAIRELRERVRQASLKYRVIVLPYLLAPGGVEGKIREALEGLFYVWDGKTLLPHVNISRWIEESIREGLTKENMRRYTGASR